MKTIKRMPVDIKVSGLSNMTKYFNQMQFNGIKEDDNIYAIDQMSLRDAKNVYIDDNLRLVSRPTLQYSDLPPEVPAFSELVDIKDFGFGKVYITKSVLNKYSVIIVPNTSVTPITGATFIIEELTNYHIATIEHYVICFNNINAKIFDTNNANQGWQNLTNYAEVPVVKRVVGETITTYDKNYFIPDLYKEEYVWSNESRPQLPAANNNKSKVIVNTNIGTFEYDLTNANKYTDLRIARPLNYKVVDTGSEASSYFSAAQSNGQNIVCIAYTRKGFFSISFNGGASFKRIYYPTYENNWGIIFGTISKDGKYFFVVMRSGVYRCNLADFTWSKPFVDPDGNIKGIQGTVNLHQSCFLTENIFSFVVRDNTNDYLYFKGPGLYAGNDYTDDHMDPSNSNYYQLQYITQVSIPNTKTLHDIHTDAYHAGDANYGFRTLDMKVVKDINSRDVAVLSLVYVGTSTNAAALVEIFGGDSSSITGLNTMYSIYKILTNPAVHGLQLLDISADASNLDITVSGISCDGGYGSDTTVNRCSISLHRASNTQITYTYTLVENLDVCGYFFQRLPLAIDDNLYIDDSNSDGLRIFDNTIDYESLKIGQLKIKYIVNDVYYAIVTELDTSYKYEFRYWTNSLQDSDSASLTYTVGSAGNFTQVPTVSYSDTELYLAFDNLLQITYNTKDPTDPTKTLFNLPKINNQSFIDKITAMINISTTEISIFFLNKIIICSKVADENLTQGFRYDYYNTKLSTGVRLGDSVINTLEGSFTLFPTLRGLAAMNYQAFMATTDQTITYITDTVKNMWTKFYNDSEQIRIIQWRNRLVLTNGTGTILLYDLTTQAWWRWELSRDVLVALSNQLDLQVINGTLLTFKENVDQYYDFGERGEFSEINWYIMSQPLHFNAPNYYKNIKQLVFQMSETEDEKSTKTMDAQIKLYRKKITIREPETVKFKIEELRTFVKRFNYWKINELQWGISNDTETSTPERLELNGMSVKYEIGEEVR